MENLSLFKNKKLFNLLLYALKDKNLSSNDFRTLFYIATNDNITVKNIKRDINIKNKNTISKILNNLIKNAYIKRNFIKTVIKKGLSSYHYMINTDKPYVLYFNKVPILLTGLLKDIDDIYTYFYTKIPKKGNKKLSMIQSKKQIQLLLEKDNFTIKQLKIIIDFVSKNNDIYKITRISNFRIKINEIIKDMKLKNNISLS